MVSIGRATGVVFSGGGARAAYQVGTLRAIAKLMPKGTAQPFPVICGTSAGAINAALLAANADSFRRPATLLDNAPLATLIRGWHRPGAPSSAPSCVGRPTPPFRLRHRCPDEPLTNRR